MTERDVFLLHAAAATTGAPAETMPHGLWLGYLVPELALPIVIALGHRAGPRAAAT